MSSAFLISASANSAISVTGYRIGADRTYTTGRDWDGVIAEVISFNTKLSDSHREAVEGYLAHKWGLEGNLPPTHTYKNVSLTQEPVVATNATSSSSSGTYYVRPSDALSKKYSLSYVDGQLVLSNLSDQSITWNQNFSGVGVGQIVDLNASASSNLAVQYAVSDSTVAELAVTNQSSLKAWWKLDETSGDASDSSTFTNTGSLRNAPTYSAGKFGNAITLDGTDDFIQAFTYNGIGGGPPDHCIVV